MSYYVHDLFRSKRGHDGRDRIIKILVTGGTKETREAAAKEFAERAAETIEQIRNEYEANPRGSPRSVDDLVVLAEQFLGELRANN